jgi:3-oxoacyl-(acyl-carrier-protein) synthase
MQSQVHVVSTGVISAMGRSTDETLKNFESHKSGISAISHLETRHRDVYPCGEVRLSNQQLAQHLGLKENLSRTILLSYHAAKEALLPFDIERLNSCRLGFFSASTIGGMDRTEDFFKPYMGDKNSGNLEDVRNHDCGKPTDYVCKMLGLRGMVTTISTACSSSANSIMLGARMIRAGKLDVVVAGGVDALSRFTLNGFNTLMIVDSQPCRPLDQSRAGLNLGEGAAYVVMMSDRMAEHFNCTPAAKVSGYSNTNDSFHQTALSDDGNGPFLAMQGALKMGGINAREVDYINMHGTGTQNNDQAEGCAIERIFSPAIPPLSSTKSFTGHTLGASGGIEAVFSILAIREGVIFPNRSFEQPMENRNIKPVTSMMSNQKINVVLSNSFGFGGNCTSLLFIKS